MHADQDGGFGITECWNSVFHKKLSRYPGITTWEMQMVLDFIRYHGFVLLSVSVYEWGRTLKQHISAAGFAGCVPTDAPTSGKSG